MNKFNPLKLLGPIFRLELGTDIGRLDAIGAALYLLLIVLVVIEPLLLILSRVLASYAKVPIAIDPWPHWYTLLVIAGFVIYMRLSLHMTARYGRPVRRRRARG